MKKKPRAKKKKPRPKKKKPQPKKASTKKPATKKAPAKMGRPKVVSERAVRRLVTLEPHQWRKLERIAERDGISVPRMIRDWVDSQSV